MQKTTVGKNTKQVRDILSNPDIGSRKFTDQDWATAGEAIEAIRQRIKANPEAAAVEARTYDEITNRVHTLRAIRKAQGLTQQQISEQLDVSQAEVSRIERRDNLHLTTLARFIEATGGKLRITAVFDTHEVEVSIGDLVRHP